MAFRKIATLLFLAVVFPSQVFAGFAQPPIFDPETKARIRAEQSEHLNNLRTKLCRAWSAVFGTKNDCGPKDPPNSPPPPPPPAAHDPGAGVSLAPMDFNDQNHQRRALDWWLGARSAWQSLSPEQRQTVYNSTLLASAAGTLTVYSLAGDTVLSLAARRILAVAGPLGALAAMTSSANANESLEYQLQYSSIETFLTDFETANAVMTTNAGRERLFGFYEELIARMN